MPSRSERHHGGEVAARTVAADAEARRIDAERACVVGDPGRRGDGVIGGGRKFVLRREPVVDGDHDELALVRELPAYDIMGIEIADHHASAVKEHQAWRKAVFVS